MSGALRSILLVEDDVDILDIAETVLTSHGGYTVEACASGEVAIQKAPVFRPDLILLDVMMPKKDGPTTLKELRTIPALAGTPVIFLTAKVQSKEVTQYLQMGAIGVIPKPFIPMTLCETVLAIWNQAFHSDKSEKSIEHHGT